MSRGRTTYRKDLRIAVRFTVDLEHGRERVQARARDLSSSGMLLIASKAVRDGARVKLSFRLYEGSPNVQSAAVVKRVQPAKAFGSETSYLIAVRFAELSQAASRGLRRFVMDEVMELLETFREFPAFAKLPELDLMAIASVCHRLELPAGRVVARSGDEAHSLYVVRTGLVRLSGTAGSHDPEDTMEVAGPGQIFGEVSALMGLPHDLDITALEDTELVGLTRSGFFLLRASHPETALRLMDIFVHFTGMRMRRLTRKLFSPLTIR